MAGRGLWRHPPQPQLRPRGVAALAAVAQFVTSVGAVASAEAIGTQVVSLPAYPIDSVGGIGSAEALGLPVLSPGPVSVSAVGAVASGEAFGALVVSVAAMSVSSVGAVASGEALGLPIVISGGSVLSSVGGIASAEAFGVTAVTVGGVTVTAVGAVASAEAFGASVVSLPPYLVGSVGAIASAGALGLPVVTVGGSSVTTVGAVGSAEAFGALVVMAQAVSITAVGAVASAEAFGALVVAPQAYVAAVGGVASGEAFGALVVLWSWQTLTGTGLASALAFGVARVNLVINGVALEIPDYEGIGSFATSLHVNEVQISSWSDTPGPISGISLDHWTPQPGHGYFLFFHVRMSTGAGYAGVLDASGQGLSWVPWGNFPERNSMNYVWAWYCVAPSDAAYGVVTIDFSVNIEAHSEYHWMILELAGADVSGVNGEHLIRYWNWTGGPGAVVVYSFALIDHDDLAFQWMGAPLPMTPEPGVLSTTESVGTYHRARAISKVGKDSLQATMSGPGSLDPWLLEYAEVAHAAAFTTYLSGPFIPSALAFGGGTAKAGLYHVVGAGTDFSVTLPAGGIVGLSKMLGVGLDLSSPVGAAGVVGAGKVMTFTSGVVARTTFQTFPSGPAAHLYRATVTPCGTLVPRLHLKRYIAASVVPRVRFSVVYRAKRAVASVVVGPVTAASVVVAPAVAANVVVAALNVAVVVVARNEDEVMSERNEFDIGDVARVTATVTSGGVLKDPSAVTFQYKTPDGTLVTGSAVKTSTGVYYGDVPCQVPGRHWWRISGSPDASFGEEGAFSVRRSSVLDT